MYKSKVEVNILFSSKIYLSFLFLNKKQIKSEANNLIMKKD